MSLFQSRKEQSPSGLTLSIQVLAKLADTGQVQLYNVHVLAAPVDAAQ